jgi:16S rRNA (guanine527-N7)-methyltransferase
MSSLVKVSSRPPLALPEAQPLDVPRDFAVRLAALRVSLDDEAVALVAQYLGFLVAMNAQMNLTAITEPQEVWSRHGLDALSLLPLLPPPRSGLRLIDVGSGGGVPGLVLAIARRELRVTLVDSTHKKAAFLSETARALGLTNVSVEAQRAEALYRTEHRGVYDVVTARAVGPLETLVPLTIPFARSGAALLYIKGARADEELNAARSTLERLKITHVRTVQTPTGRVVELRAPGPPRPKAS